MERFGTDLEGVARACVALGVDTGECSTAQELERSVLAAGRERLGYAGLASLTAARVTRLPDHVLQELHALVRRLAPYDVN